MELDKKFINEVVQEVTNDIKQNYIKKDILDKIRADIAELKRGVEVTMYNVAIDNVLEIIDNYKTKSEE